MGDNSEGKSILNHRFLYPKSGAQIPHRRGPFPYDNSFPLEIQPEVCHRRTLVFRYDHSNRPVNRF